MLRELTELFARPGPPDELPEEVTVDRAADGDVTISHDGPAQAGFSELDVLWPEEFRRLLVSHGLDPEAMHTVERTDEGENGDLDVYVWASGSLLVASTTNPFDLEADGPDDPCLRTGGYGESVAIEGCEGAVRSMYSDMKIRAYDFAACNPESREFL